MPGIDILKWETSVSRVDWGVPISVGAFDVLTVALTNNSVVDWMCGRIDFIGAYSQITVIFLFVFLNVIGHFIIPGIMPVMCVMVPIAAVMAATFDLNSTALALAICVGAHMTTIFPMADEVSLVLYPLKYWTIKDSIKGGTPVALIHTVISTLFISFDLAVGIL